MNVDIRVPRRVSENVDLIGSYSEAESVDLRVPRSAAERVDLIVPRREAECAFMRALCDNFLLDFEYEYNRKLDGMEITAAQYWEDITVVSKLVGVTIEVIDRIRSDIYSNTFSYNRMYEYQHQMYTFFDELAERYLKNE